MQGVAEKLLAKADIAINGDRPWDMQVHDDRLYRRVMAGGSLALGEAYMDGWWDCAQLDEFFARVLDARLDRQTGVSWRSFWRWMQGRIFNLQRKSRAYHIGEHHYDRGNRLFEFMLDERMNYSSAYWKEADNLDEAQEAKLDLICRKIGLEEGDRVLDIGCGWGGFAGYAAEKYGAEVVGVTVSKEQVKWARERYDHLPVEFRLQDYRDLDETFDHVVSIGMFEHVGEKNHATFMDVARRCLKEDGLLLLHTIGGLDSSKTTDPWIDKYIFPDGYIPAPMDMTQALEGRFMMEDWHNFGAYYDPTLMAWYENFTEHWDELQADYDERFYRMWTYYLQMSAGSFRARRNQLWQLVLSPEGVDGGYVSVR